MGALGGGDRWYAGRDVTGERPRGARARARGAGRDDEAELLLREAIDSLAATDYRNSEPEVLAAYSRFLRDRGRDDEAEVVEGRLAELLEPVGATPLI